MIRIITGKLGAGKTLYCSMEILSALVRGLTVITNIAINWPEICALAAKKYRVILQPEQLIRIDVETRPNWHEYIPFGVVDAFVEVFLDEIHLFFNARDWQKTGTQHKTLLSFLSQSRKANVNVTFIAQEISTIEKQFRVLAEWEEYIVPSSHMPLGILGSSPIKFFFIVLKDTENHNVLKRSIRTYNRSYFRIYESFGFLDSTMNELSSSAVRIEPKKLKKLSFFKYLFFPISKLKPKI
jgi:Zonular occludens toxin (Zot)